MLSPEQVNALVDALRRSLLYQTPQPIYDSSVDADVPALQPKWMQVRMPPLAYGLVMQLIEAAGGWTLPRLEKQKILAAAEERARVAFQNLPTDPDVRYKLDAWEYGDLVSTLRELEAVLDVPELRRFHDHISEELARRTRTAGSPQSA